jgi:hypothetical protein
MENKKPNGVKSSNNINDKIKDAFIIRKTIEKTKSITAGVLIKDALSDLKEDIIENIKKI